MRYRPCTALRRYDGVQWLYLQKYLEYNSAQMSTFSVEGAACFAARTRETPVTIRVQDDTQCTCLAQDDTQCLALTQGSAVYSHVIHSCPLQDGSASVVESLVRTWP
jgi:hypothetical protein